MHALLPENIIKPYIVLMFSGDEERVDWEQLDEGVISAKRVLILNVVFLKLDLCHLL